MVGQGCLIRKEEKGEGQAEEEGRKVRRKCGFTSLRKL